MKRILTMLFLFCAIAVFPQAAVKINNAQNVYSTGQPRVIVSCDTLPAGTFRLYPKDQVTWKFNQLTSLPNTLSGYGINDAVPITRKVNNYALGTDINLGKDDIGLGNVDNTPDMNKPVSTPMALALSAKLDVVVASTMYQPLLAFMPAPNTRKINNYPLTADINLTKSDVGLSNVDNVSDANKPISNATQTALNLKVDKVAGKQLSTEDYTTSEKAKLASIKDDYIHTASVTSAGNAIFYLTNDKTSTGTALYSNVNFVIPFVNSSSVNYTYEWAYNSGTKALTVNVKSSTGLYVSLLNLTLLGVPANVANGTSVQVLVKGS